MSGSGGISGHGKAGPEAGERSGHTVGCKLAVTRQEAVKFAIYSQATVKKAAEHILDYRLPLLDYHHGVAVVGKFRHKRARHRILRNLQHGERASLGETLTEIIGSDTRHDYAQTPVGAGGKDVERRHLRLMLEVGLLLYKLTVAHTRIAGHEHPLAGITWIMKFILRTRSVISLHNGTRVGQTGYHAHQHGDT